MAEESEWSHECFFWYPLEEKQGSCQTDHLCDKDSKALELKSIKVRITPKLHLHKGKLNYRYPDNFKWLAKLSSKALRVSVHQWLKFKPREIKPGYSLIIY